MQDYTIDYHGRKRPLTKVEAHKRFQHKNCETCRFHAGQPPKECTDCQYVSYRNWMPAEGYTE